MTAAALHNWLADYCSGLWGGDWEIADCAPDFLAHHAFHCLLARSAGDSAAIVTTTAPVGIVELSGQIVAAAANLPGAALPSAAARPNPSRILVVLSTPVPGLGPVRRLLQRSAVRVDTVHVRLFQESAGELFIVAESEAESGTRAVNHGDAIETEMEVFGDPVRAIINSLETNHAG